MPIEELNLKQEMGAQGRFKEITANKILEEFPHFEGFAIYNYEGTHFRLFRTFEDGLTWLENRSFGNDEIDSLIIANSDDQCDIDLILFEKVSELRLAKIKSLEAEIASLKISQHWSKKTIQCSFTLADIKKCLREAGLKATKHNCLVIDDYLGSRMNAENGITWVAIKAAINDCMDSLGKNNGKA